MRLAPRAKLTRMAPAPKRACHGAITGAACINQRSKLRPEEFCGRRGRAAAGIRNERGWPDRRRGLLPVEESPRRARWGSVRHLPVAGFSSRIDFDQGTRFPAFFGAWRSLASAPALGAGGRRFKSSRPDFEGTFSLRNSNVPVSFRTIIGPFPVSRTDVEPTARRDSWVILRGRFLGPFVGHKCELEF